MNIYRPPPVLADSLKSIFAIVSSVKKKKELLILGDFNSNWLARSSSNERNLIQSINLTQLIKEPTRRGKTLSTLIDWILVTHPDRISSSVSCPIVLVIIQWTNEQNHQWWFCSYLHNRKQYVIFNDAQSDKSIVERGVPQGSTFGPLLFSIFINDLPNTFTSCAINLYADDTVLYKWSSNLALL